MYQTPKPTNRKLLLIVGIITVILIIIIVVVDIVMWSTNKGLYKPYVPPPTPSTSVAPNGNSSDPDSQIMTLNNVYQSGISNNMTSYKANNPGTDPFQFGSYQNNP
jgi:flagellar basal body-associated protein FliL